MEWIVAFILLAIAGWLARELNKTKISLAANTSTLEKYKERYAPIIDIDNAIAQANSEKNKIDADVFNLRSSYIEKKQMFDSLVAQAAIYDEKIEIAEYGHYEPHFDFGTADEYKDKLQTVKDKQKDWLKSDRAAWIPNDFTFNNSLSKGRAMLKRTQKLALRAFNGDADAAIANTCWNNAGRMIQRIEKSAETIAKLNKETGLHILQDYISLRIDELRLVYEYEEKKQAEKKEQAEMRRQMREEAKFEQDAERAIREERKYEEMLSKAKADAENATGGRLEALQEKISALTAELEEAHAKAQRALSMAQQTRAGYVYVISNIGSFGQDVYKLGMTRRLDPMDRVKELGDASVPFTFDVHALIYSEDAPALENALHKEFENHRLNMVNYKKEFFKANLDDIKAAVLNKIPNASFVTDAEARDHHETLAIKAQREASLLAEDVRLDFPASI
jgi:hypothetical protein